MKGLAIFLVVSACVLLWKFRRPLCAKMYILVYFGLIRPFIYRDRVCFYSLLVFLFTGAKKHSDILLYRHGTVYIIKRLGCIDKLTNIVSKQPNQIEYIRLRPMPLAIYNPSSESRSKPMQFDLIREKFSLQHKVWANTHVQRIETCLLLFPKPLNFSQEVNGENVILYPRDRFNESLLHTVKSFRKSLKKEMSKDTLSREEWRVIKRDYRRH